MTKLADLVRDARSREGLTQEQLDDRIGMSQGYTGMLEIGRVGRPKAKTRRKLADVLAISLDDIARAVDELDEAPERDPASLLLELDALPTAEARLAAFRELPAPMRQAIRRLMRDLFAEAAQQLEE